MSHKNLCKMQNAPRSKRIATITVGGVCVFVCGSQIGPILASHTSYEQEKSHFMHHCAAKGGQRKASLFCQNRFCFSVDIGKSKSYSYRLCARRTEHLQNPCLQPNLLREMSSVTHASASVWPKTTVWAPPLEQAKPSRELTNYFASREIKRCTKIYHQLCERSLLLRVGVGRLREKEQWSAT